LLTSLEKLGANLRLARLPLVASLLANPYFDPQKLGSNSQLVMFTVSSRRATSPQEGQRHSMPLVASLLANPYLDPQKLGSNSQLVMFTVSSRRATTLNTQVSNISTASLSRLTIFFLC
jgi:hypothetical protein